MGIRYYSILDSIKFFHFMDNKFEIEIVGNPWKDDQKNGKFMDCLSTPIKSYPILCALIDPRCLI